MTRTRVVLSFVGSIAVYGVLTVVTWLMGNWLALLAPVAPLYAAVQIAEDPDIAIAPLIVSAAVVICVYAAVRRPQSRTWFGLAHASLLAYYALSLWLACGLSRNLPSGL